MHVFKHLCDVFVQKFLESKQGIRRNKKHLIFSLKVLALQMESTIMKKEKGSREPHIKLKTQRAARENNSAVPSFQLAGTAI